MVDCFLQSNKPNGRQGAARQSGNNAFATGFYVYVASGRLLLVKTRFNRFAQVMDARFSAGVWSASSTEWHFLRLPRLAGVTFERYLL
jgi:hypothetical protein